MIRAKRFLCAICRENGITYTQIEHVMQGDVPDQSNCDFSTYTYEVKGGKLLKNRPPAKSELVGMDPKTPRAKMPIGAICNCCLKSLLVRNLMESGNITFEENIDGKSNFGF